MTSDADSYKMHDMATRGRPSTFDLYDRLVFNGQLATILRDWRAEGLTYPAIKQRLAARGVIAHEATVNRWVLALEAAS